MSPTFRLNTTRRFVLLSCTLTGALMCAQSTFAAPPAATDAVRVSRYTELVGPSRTERDPLAVVAQLHFPREVVSNVGDALRYLLQRTGYSLQASDADAEKLLTLPLPESQRTVGPHRVVSLVQLLVGDAFIVCPSARTRVLSIVADDNTSAPCSPAPATTAVQEP